MKRQIIQIDEDKCNGCGLCIPNCHEGALQIIDGKCRLISDLFCDGLGACIGHCPEGALEIIEREAEAYDERKVMALMLGQGMNVVTAHLKHLKEHNEMELYSQAINYLKENSINIPEHSIKKESMCSSGGCPGANTVVFDKKPNANIEESKSLQSELNQWPIQLHLVNPNAQYLRDAEIGILSTCSAFSTPNIHKDYIANRAVLVACPKLDYTEPYTPKLQEIFKNNNTQKVVIVRMEVPCCGGLTKIAVDAARLSEVKGIIVEEHTLSIQGDFLKKSILYQG